MQCPHCRKEFHDQIQQRNLGEDIETYWAILQRTCPACKRFILHLGRFQWIQGEGGKRLAEQPYEVRLVHPKASSRPPCPPEVPQEFAEDYTEACLVLADSPKASAALSRRCLQSIIRDVAKVSVKSGNLADEIQELLNRQTLPSHIAEAIDAVRNIGNFAAHPMKSNATGLVLPVEPGEAEWNLDVLEALFDFYFVQPELLKKKKDALNNKLKEAGKPPMK